MDQLSMSGRYRIGALLIGLIVVVVVLSANRMSGTANHTWHGTQTSFTTHVHMPAGPVPYVLKTAWLLRYRYACPSLHPPKGMAPNTFLHPVLRLDVESSIADSGMKDMRGTASHILTFPDGGSYTIRLHIRHGCGWRLRSSSA
jgi:hypothetical protein